MYMQCTCHLSRPCIYHVKDMACAISLFYEYVSQEFKKCYGSRFEHMILCIIESCHDNYAISVMVKLIIVA